MYHFHFGGVGLQWNLLKFGVGDVCWRNKDQRILTHQCWRKAIKNLWAALLWGSSSCSKNALSVIRNEDSGECLSLAAYGCVLAFSGEEPAARAIPWPWIPVCFRMTHRPSPKIFTDNHVSRPPGKYRHRSIQALYKVNFNQHQKQLYFFSEAKIQEKWPVISQTFESIIATG